MIRPIDAASERYSSFPQSRQVATVLLADSDLASRLSLKSIFIAAGYAVDGAASSAEAVSWLDDRQYQLVLADLRAESDEAGSRVLAYARQKDYRPATALIASEMRETSRNEDAQESDRAVHISDENVSYLLGNVADLISNRASRRMRRQIQAP